MQLTIDSAEPLEHVLRVVGSLYGAELVVASPAPAQTTDVVAKPVRRSRPVAAPRGRRSTSVSRGKRARGRAPSTADVRAWAQGQGLAVRDRGRIAADIVRAYTDAH